MGEMKIFKSQVETLGCSLGVSYSDQTVDLSDLRVGDKL
jgi:hypothetical protein